MCFNQNFNFIRRTEDRRQKKEQTNCQPPIMTITELNQMMFEDTELEDLVIISFGPFDGLDEIHEVDSVLFENIPENIGHHDGHEVNMDDTDGCFFTYGKNAETLYKTMQPLLKPFGFLEKATAYLRFTEDGAFKSDLEFRMN